MKNKKKVIDTAVLKVKCIKHPINPETISFEDYIGSSNTSIKIDLFNGRSFMEKGFRTHEVPLEKFFIEFFDSYAESELMDYLMNPQNDFRVTSMDGTIIRMCQMDYDMVSNSVRDSNENHSFKKYVFVRKKQGLFQKIRGVIHKKDN